MTKKKIQHQSHTMSLELQNILAGGILIILSVLMFLATKEVSIIGKYLALLGGTLFLDEYYRWIFSPITFVLGIMILSKKASWSLARATGLLIYFMTLTSVVGYIQGKTV